MRFLGIRLNERRLPLRRAIRRLIGLGLSVITFGIGFLGIVFGESRRGWADRMGDTEVVYDERRPVPAPWSTLSRARPGRAARGRYAGRRARAADRRRRRAAARRRGP